jgi:hypothetical protein
LCALPLARRHWIEPPECEVALTRSCTGTSTE